MLHGAGPVDLEGFRESMKLAGIEDVVDVTLDVYLDEARELFDGLMGAAEAGDLAVVGARSHTLKSSSANVWAGELASLCATIEGAARDGDSTTVTAMLSPFAREFERVVSYLGAVRRGEA